MIHEVSGLVLAIAGGDGAGKHDVGLDVKDETETNELQKWDLASQGQLKNRGNGLVLVVKGGNKKAGAAVIGD